MRFNAGQLGLKQGRAVCRQGFPVEITTMLQMLPMRLQSRGAASPGASAGSESGHSISPDSEQWSSHMEALQVVSPLGKEETSSIKLSRNSSTEAGPKAGVTPWAMPREDFGDVKEGLSRGFDPRADTEPC